MATRNTTAEEREIILEMQKDMERAKRAGAQVERGAQKLYALLEKSGEAPIAAEAYSVKAQWALANGQMDVAHSRATDALLNCFDDGGPVVFGGGGRGG